tara:strand:+ start:4602 stop:6287 length:1686 start_codon:yes stop_codon:yes gene_type:complete
MANFNGTQVADTISGTNDDDVITGLAGNDVINGAAGNDLINGGEGVDNILGGLGNDTITVASSGDLGLGTVVIGNDSITGMDITEENDGDIMDGGAGTDLLVAGLLDGDDLNNGMDTETLWGVTGVQVSNFEFVQVSNASDFMLDLSADAVFGSDLRLTSTAPHTAASASGASALNILGYTASSGAVALNETANTDAGVVIDGETYMSGDTYESADGGTVVITAEDGFWTFNYTAEDADTYAVGVGEDAADDIVTTIVATITNADGSTADVTVDLALDLDANFNASNAMAGINSRGDFQSNEMIGSAFDDVIFAGSTSGMESDRVVGLDGNDLLAGGGGSDTLDGGTGNDTLFAGAGDDFAIGEDGDDMIWGGAGDDFIGGGDGDDVIGGGLGEDTLYGDSGNDVIYGGSDDGADLINGGTGNDSIFAGAGDDDIAGGTGDDLIFNGAGSDNVNGGAGNDVIWGGAGNDALTGGADDDTFGFVAGNGNDSIADFGFDDEDDNGNDVLDLTAFGYANTQAVLDDMSNVDDTATLALAPGQTITFEGLTVNDFQTAVDDWVLV